MLAWACRVFVVRDRFAPRLGGGGMSAGGYGDPAAGGKARLGKRIAPARIMPVEHAGVEGLFPKGAGELHVYGPVEM